MSKRRLFEAHGVVFTGQSGDQLFGRCPFTGKDNKFYVNSKTWLWDSKTAGLSGNPQTFLGLISQHYTKLMTDSAMRRLTENRKLPRAAFTPWFIGWTGHAYTIPIKDPAGTVVDVRMWRPGGKMLSTPTVTVGLLGAERLNKYPSDPVYLCEGEWDAIALYWLMRKLGQRGVVLAVPGAATFKVEWVPWISGRTVITLYDHDDAGRTGEARTWRLLSGSVQRLSSVHWPESCPTGYDVRDWIVQRAVDERALTPCWEELIALIQPNPRPQGDAPRPLSKPSPGASSPVIEPMTEKKAGNNGHQKSRWTRPPTLNDVLTTFKKWLYLDSTDPILIMLATVVSQSIDGPPIWMFLVSPPGGAKTETLSSLSTHSQIYSTSSLTTHALISGANWRDGVDPSLIPRLNGKIMVIKDFTSILAMRDTEKDEIFGILRDAYDGKCGKVFGTGIERQYTSRFTILAAVTPRIYDLSSQHTSLGERFLKYAMGDNLIHVSERDIIRRAIQNINRETEMRGELQDVVTQFLTRTVKTSPLPNIPEEYQHKLIYLAMFGARMRGSVSRDMYRNDIITSRPSAEVGSRLGIQLAKLGQALAIVMGHSELGDPEYRILKKVVLDTIPQRTEDMLRHILRACPDPTFTITAHDLAHSSRYPIATVSRILQDLNVLDIVQREGTIHRFRWTLTPYIRTCLKEAELYASDEEIDRPTRVFVRVVRRRKSGETRTNIETSPGPGATAGRTGAGFGGKTAAKTV